ncbi:MAG: serine protease Do [Chloroflexi bacterium]|nr:MAG: serine protease Do [Chloroflexota bacterium]
MFDTRFRLRLGLGLVLLILTGFALVACGGSSDDPEEPAASDAQAEEPSVQAEEEPEAQAEQAEEQVQAQDGDTAVADSGRGGGDGNKAAAVDDGVIRTLADVEQAVVRIVAEGSFRDPDVGELLNVAGSGSGFIISESGLVVTNNHVVTGAALLQVFFGGDESNPINARILGVSECSDLAVIDLEGDGYPFLGWHEGVITVGLSAFAAGFPLGDPEFTLTSGIVGKADADGESSWASVDRVLEHDAAILPGNSGGPLVTEGARIIGINYAGNDAGQNFAIRADEAQRILDRLIAGEDVTSLGVNGQAIQTLLDGDLISGVWVASVASGSPADDVGLQSGDIITRLEGLLLAQDGTMGSYCDILRTRGADDVLAIEVLRASTGQVLEGRLNTGETLSESFSFGAVGGEVGGIGTGESYSGFVEIEDETGNLVVHVPVEWSDVEGGPWVLDGDEIGISVTASADIQQFFGVWTEPGVFVGASTQLPPDPDGLLDEFRTQFPFDTGCEYVGRESYADPLYTGLFDTWQNCGGEDVLYISLIAMPEDQAFVINVQVQVVTAADFEALDRVLDTFLVTPPGGASGPAPPPVDETASYADFGEITDATGSITVVVPTAWADVTSPAWENADGDVIGVQMNASTDVAAWQAGWGAPGVYIAASSEVGLDPNAWLDAYNFTDCTYVGRESYEDPLYVGSQDVWIDCGPEGSTFIAVSALPADGSFLVIVEAVLVEPRDLEALERVLATFVARR